MSTSESPGTRATLVRVAADLLEREGIAAVTLRAVGTHAGVSRTAPYRHFADKEALLSAVAAADLLRLRDTLVTAAGGVDGPSARLTAMTSAYVRFAMSQPAHYRLMFTSAQRKREDPDLKEAAEAALGVLIGAVADAQAARELPGADPLPLAGLLWSTGHGAVDLALGGYTDPAKGLPDPESLLHTLLGVLRGAGGTGVVGGRGGT